MTGDRAQRHEASGRGVPIHGHLPRRGEYLDRGAPATSGKFGRMFDLPPCEPSDRALVELSKVMFESADEATSTEGDNSAVPAGYTYLGQFIDHDITFDPTSLQEQRIDPNALENFRTPALDLDSVYGGGPGVQPFLYRRAPDDTDLFEIGQTAPSKSGGDQSVRALPPLPHDLPRTAHGLALIADPRNDENLIVAQLHLAMLRFHNQIVRSFKNGSLPREYPFSMSVFDEARQTVVWHYQWVVVNDFLRRIVDDRVLDEELRRTETIYDGVQYPYMPVEFSMAAYRLGHSMVRDVYDYNRVFRPGGVAPATLGLLFRFSGRSGARRSADPEPTPIPTDWVIDWERFFQFPGKPAPNLSRKLNAKLAPTLGQIPNVGNPHSPDPVEQAGNLALRNLFRGRRAGLPSGQTVAKHYGVNGLHPDQIGDNSPDGKVARANNLHLDTPLWYYVLKEADVMGKGKHLGPVGSRIVASVIVGLLKRDPLSYLNRRTPWQPTLPTAGQPHQLKMSDLLAFAGAVNPLTSGSAADMVFRSMRELEAADTRLSALRTTWQTQRSSFGEQPNEFQAFRRHVLLVTGNPDPAGALDIGDDEPTGFRV
ncbi:MAG: heme peroxidase family protein [Chloroflexota bacterium]